MAIPLANHPTGKINFTVVEVGAKSVAYSYSTPVAYNMRDGNGWVVVQNQWGPTTGKHLNLIDPDHSKRLPLQVFNERLHRLFD